MSWSVEMRYTKPFRTVEEQTDILAKRGMEADHDHLIQCLENVGYYRLSGYWHIFKQPDDTFRTGTTFEKVWDLYTFDRQFRLIVLDAIERIEVYFRAQLSHKLARETGPFGYTSNDNLPRLNPDKYADLMRRCRDSYSKSREAFVDHFKEVYGDEHDLPPYWMLVNLMDFGMVFTLYRGAPNSIREEIANEFSVRAIVLDSWLRTINTTRNICAHHGRLWNRTLGTRPKIPDEKNDPRWYKPYEVKPDKIFVVLTILSLMLETAAPNTDWRTRLFNLLSKRSKEDLRRMGFEDGWETCPIWSKWNTDLMGNESEDQRER